MQENVNAQPQQASPQAAAPTTAQPGVDAKPKWENEYADRFAKLTAKESQLRRLEQELKEIREENSKYKSLREQAKLKPESVLEEYGLSYENLTKRMLEGGTDDKYMSLEQRLAKIEERERNFEQQEQERKNNELQSQALSHLKVYVEQNAEQYELIKINDAYEDVLDLAARYYRETGRYLDFAEAANLVEKHLEKTAEVWMQSKKLKDKMFPSEKKEGEQIIQGQQSPKTLSNIGTSSAPQDASVDEKELLQRAISSYRNGRKNK